MTIKQGLILSYEAKRMLRELGERGITQYDQLSISDRNKLVCEIMKVQDISYQRAILFVGDREYVLPTAIYNILQSGGSIESLLAFYQEILKIYVLGDFDGYDAYFAEDIDEWLEETRPAAANEHLQVDNRERARDMNAIFKHGY